MCESTIGLDNLVITFQICGIIAVGFRAFDGMHERNSLKCRTQKSYSMVDCKLNRL